MADDKQNIFIATLYSFIPLEGKPKGEYKELMRGASEVEPDRLLKYTAAKFCVKELKAAGGDFYYEYNLAGTKVKRKVLLRAWLYKFSSVINQKGRYYLVTTISIDKSFGDKDEIPQFPFSLSNICTSQDIAQLKKAAYGGDDYGLYYFDGSKKHYMHYYLNHLVEKITGKNTHGKYGRHYIVDVCCVGIPNNQRIGSHKRLTELFSQEYYSTNRKPLDEVVENYRELVYSLFFGNENNEVIPEDALQKTLRSSFSNNWTERLFAYHKTIVFLHTHHPYPWKPEHDGKQKELNENVQNDKIVFDAFLVMEARLKLKSIGRALRIGEPQNIKDALASISSYLATNPYRLGEYGQRVKMLYRNMGIIELLNTIKLQGNLLSDAKEIENNERLSRRVYVLTAITVVVGVMSLIVSILCCNTCGNNSKTINDMCNCISESTGCIGSCCAVVGVLLGLVLAASIIMMAVYQVMTYFKLKDIEGEIKNLQK